MGSCCTSSTDCTMFEREIINVCNNIHQFLLHTIQNYLIIEQNSLKKREESVNVCEISKIEISSSSSNNNNDEDDLLSLSSNDNNKDQELLLSSSANTNCDESYEIVEP